MEAERGCVPWCAPSLPPCPTWVTQVVVAVPRSHLQSGGTAVGHSLHLPWGTHRAVLAAACIFWGVTSAFPWPPAPPVALPHLRPLCPYQAERAGCWAGSLPQPTTLLLPPGHAAPACSACCPPPVGAWGQGSRGVCPPPALGERCRRSLCCHARQRGCVGVSPVPGGLWLCQEQRDLTGAPLIPNPLS